MQTSETLLKTQRSLSTLHGTKKIAVGLIIISSLLGLTEFIVDPASRAHWLRSLGSWANLISIGVMMYVTSAHKARELEWEIGREGDPLRP